MTRVKRLEGDFRVTSLLVGVGDAFGVIGLKARDLLSLASGTTEKIGEVYPFLTGTGEDVKDREAGRSKNHVSSDMSTK